MSNLNLKQPSMVLHLTTLGQLFLIEATRVLTGSPHAQTPLITLRSHFLIPALLYILKGICYAYCLREFSINSPVLSCLFLSSLKRTPDIRSSPHPPPRSDGSHCALAPAPFRLRARLFPYRISTWGVWEWGLPVRIYYYSLRGSADKLTVPLPPHYSFSYRGAVLWNSLPVDLRQAQTLTSFKSGCSSFVFG